MTLLNSTLADLGWSTHFMMQLDSDELANLIPMRISEVHRSQLSAQSEAGPASITTPPDFSTAECAVGDWVLVDPEIQRITRILDRNTLLQRRAAGTDARGQLIAANIDTLFIVSSCNADFNLARLERYLALAGEAQVQPVLLLTKADQCDDPLAYEQKAQVLDPMLPVITMNATEATEIKKLFDWWRKGQTAVLLGSSGVGKSTLLNGLAGTELATAAVRADDAKGRHTTTSRSLHLASHGGWLIDTPGMRALKLQSASDGVDTVFDDLVDLATACKFSDCQHDSEPGCAVQAAIAASEIDPVRLERWRKLQLEDRHNTESVTQARQRGKVFGQMLREVKSERKRRGKR